MAVLSRVLRSRSVKRFNQRWDRQKPITRGHVDDHAEVEPSALASSAQ